MTGQNGKYRRKKKRKRSKLIWAALVVCFCFGCALGSVVTLRYVSTRELNNTVPELGSEGAPRFETVEKGTQEDEVFVPPEIIDWIMRKSSRVPRTLAKTIARECAKTDHPVIILALIARESSFNPFARSKAGAIGLGQILPKVWFDELSKKGLVREKRDLFDPVINIRCTNFVFNETLKRSNGNLSVALARYVGGGSNSAYVRDVLVNIGELVVLLGDRHYGRSGG